MHYKSETKKILVKDLIKVYEKFISFSSLKIKKSVLNKKVFFLIIQQADQILKSNKNSQIKLENKIVLSIASRLKAEEFMFNKIKDQKFKRIIENKRNYSAVLLNKFIQEFPDQRKRK
ncbi:MAG: hypothetical protein KatS3mg091_396 [Patescibacteria group bacterium]|nr:MAG: hypothetical protein KatS3mg090_0747 [Patescibacteria group bacterium]GIW63594.1 MAG: hypothetical protein KatS3mg091_396 [Patescibacteria group bacterium]